MDCMDRMNLYRIGYKVMEVMPIGRCEGHNES